MGTHYVAVNEPTLENSQVVNVATIPSYHRKLTLMDDLINHQLSLTTLCREAAMLSIFTDFMTICRVQKLYANKPGWKEQKYKERNSSNLDVEISPLTSLI